MFNFGANPGVDITVILYEEFKKPCCATFTSVENMEKVSLNNVELDNLAQSHISLDGLILPEEI